MVGLGSSADMLGYYEMYGVVPALFTSGEVRPWLGLLTGMFIHIGPWHLLSSTLFLFCFGGRVERIVNWQLFLVVCGFCGIFGNLWHVVFYPGSHLAVVGSSGVVSGLLGFTLLLRGWDWGNFGFGRFVFRRIWLVVFWFGQQMFYLFLALDGILVSSDTPLVVHLAGFIAGLGLARFLRLVRLVD